MVTTRQITLCFIRLALVMFVIASVSFANPEKCATYTINHIYGSDDPQRVSNSFTKGEPGAPGKLGPAGPPGVGIKGSKGDVGPPGENDANQLQTFHKNLNAMLHKTVLNKWTNSLTGCRCNFNQSRTDCACCKNGGCACGASNHQECVPCGQEELCGNDIPRTCDDIGGNRSGIYLISPNFNLVQPFYVKCQFTEDESVTQVMHDALNETQVKNHEGALSYKRTIKYNAEMTQIQALIDVSATCVQFIKYRCVDSVLLFHGNAQQYAAWVSRDGEVMRYWGGATSRRDRFCACGETNACDVSGLKCNCDKNSGPETSDEGFLDDKTKLPVTKLMFGDTGDGNERGWHTLGELRCSGTA